MGKTRKEGPDLLEGTTFTLEDSGRPPGGILYELSRFFAEEREHARRLQPDQNDAVTPALRSVVWFAHAIICETPCHGAETLTDLPERAQWSARALGIAHEALEALRAGDAVNAAGSVMALGHVLRELRFGPLIEHGEKFPGGRRKGAVGFLARAVRYAIEELGARREARSVAHKLRHAGTIHIGNNHTFKADPLDEDGLSYEVRGLLSDVLVDADTVKLKALYAHINKVPA